MLHAVCCDDAAALPALWNRAVARGFEIQAPAAPAARWRQLPARRRLGACGARNWFLSALENLEPGVGAIRWQCSHMP